jgi:hypothetical protein
MGNDGLGDGWSLTAFDKVPRRRLEAGRSTGMAGIATIPKDSR